MALCNILVVDDEVGNLRALKRALRHEYSVFTATNSEDALAIMEQNDIAVIIADQRLPGMSGGQLLERTLRKYPKTIRIILTAYTNEELLMNSINKVHAHGYLTKPWEPDEMKSIVRKCLSDQQRLLRDGQRQGLSFWRQRVLGEATQEASQRQDTVILQFTHQLEQMQHMLEAHTRPWWRRWFRKRGRQDER